MNSPAWYSADAEQVDKCLPHVCCHFRGQHEKKKIVHHNQNYWLQKKPRSKCTTNVFIL